MPDFQEKDREAIISFLEAHPLGMLAAVGEEGSIEATHIPLLVHRTLGGFVLRGLVMRKTSHWHALKAASEVFVAFTGPDAPVLASWNENIVFGGTWNYMAVHVRGRINFLPEPELIEILRTLKDTYEDSAEAKFDLLPPEYVSMLLPAIEGFEIEVTSMEAVFKLSQNRSLADFDSTVEALRKRGGECALVAEEMAARKEKYFGVLSDG